MSKRKMSVKTSVSKTAEEVGIQSSAVCNFINNNKQDDVNMFLGECSPNPYD